MRALPVIEPQIAFLDSAVGGPTWRASMAHEYRSREMQSLQIAMLSRGERWVLESNRVAARVATFCGCDADEVLLFTHGAGEALGIVTNGLDLAAGDEVITTTLEHPAALSLARARATARHRRQTDRATGADEWPGGGPRAPSGRYDRPREG